jgi:flagellar biogenesis protein FliO
MSNGMQLIRSAEQTIEGKITADPQGLAGWVLRWLRSSRNPREVPSKQIHLVETLQLGGKRQLMLISCAGAKFLVGGGPESIEVIVGVPSDVLPRSAAKNVNPTCE